MMQSQEAEGGRCPNQSVSFAGRTTVALLAAALCWLGAISISFPQSRIERLEMPTAAEREFFVTARARKEDADALGKEMLAILNDETQAPENRVQAARLLGEMRYLDAIPHLIRHRSIRPRIIFDSGDAFPVHTALAKFGDAAVPALIQDYLHEERSPTWRSSKESYLGILKRGNALRAARVYAKGLLAEAGTHEKKHSIQKLVTRIEACEAPERRAHVRAPTSSRALDIPGD